MNCPKCNGRRAVLATHAITWWLVDSEQFADPDEIDDEMSLGCHYCLDCGEVIDIWIESPRVGPAIEVMAEMENAAIVDETPF